jgi:ketosteroid isomerase-like protein
MRKVVAVLMFLSLAAAGAVAAEDPVAALKAADQAWSKASLAHNLDELMIFVGDDIYACGPDGKWTHGAAAFREQWAAMMKDPGFKLAWTVETAEVSKDGRMGYTRGAFQGTFGGKPAAGAYTTVWKKGTDGKWRAIVDIAAGQ